MDTCNYLYSTTFEIKHNTQLDLYQGVTLKWEMLYYKLATTTNSLFSNLTIIIIQIMPEND